VKNIQKNRKILYKMLKLCYQEVDCALDQNAQRREQMFRISGKKELPQVHCDGKYIGVSNFFLIFQIIEIVFFID
jgi:glutaredoxin